MQKHMKKCENKADGAKILTSEHIETIERLLAAGEKLELRLVRDELGIWVQTKKRIS